MGGSRPSARQGAPTWSPSLAIRLAEDSIASPGPGHTQDNRLVQRHTQERLAQIWHCNGPFPHQALALMWVTPQGGIASRGCTVGSSCVLRWYHEKGLGRLDNCLAALVHATALNCRLTCELPSVMPVADYCNHARGRLSPSPRGMCDKWSTSEQAGKGGLSAGPVIYAAAMLRHLQVQLLAAKVDQARVQCKRAV